MDCKNLDVAWTWTCVLLSNGWCQHSMGFTEKGSQAGGTCHIEQTNYGSGYINVLCVLMCVALDCVACGWPSYDSFCCSRTIGSLVLSAALQCDCLEEFMPVSWRLLWGRWPGKLIECWIASENAQKQARACLLVCRFLFSAIQMHANLFKMSMESFP